MEQKAWDNEYELLLRQIGSHLAEARKNKGVSQRTLAEALGKNPAMIARVEKSGGQRTSLRSFFEVARSIGVSLGDVISRSESDLDFVKNEPKQPSDRIEAISSKLESLSVEDQEWFLSTIESLLVKASPLRKGAVAAPRDVEDTSRRVCSS